MKMKIFNKNLKNDKFCINYLRNGRNRGAVFLPIDYRTRENTKEIFKRTFLIWSEFLKKPFV